MAAGSDIDTPLWQALFHLQAVSGKPDAGQTGTITPPPRTQQHRYRAYQHLHGKLPAPDGGSLLPQGKDNAGQAVNTHKRYNPTASDITLAGATIGDASTA